MVCAHFSESHQSASMKVIHFWHSKPPFTKFTLATRKFTTMKAVSAFKIEIWCKDLAYVDKVAKNNTGVKYLLVRGDLDDWNPEAEGMKTRHSSETVRIFWLWLQKRIDPKLFGSIRPRKLNDSSKQFAKLKEYIFTLQGVRLRLLLMKLQYGFWKHFTVIRSNKDTSTFTNCLNSWQPWILEKIFDTLDTKECHEHWLFVQSPQQGIRKLWKTQS